MKKLLISLIFLALAGVASAQKVGIKNNLLYDAALTPNLGFEFGLGKKTSLDVSGGYNWYDIDDTKHWKHWIVQPEFRYWFCERFNGSFLGFHAHGGEFNLSGFDFPFDIISDLKENLYEGSFYGAGISFGHQWILGKRWNLEAVVGAGYARIEYEKYTCEKCGPLLEKSHTNYWGPTKAGVSFIFFF